MTMIQSEPAGRHTGAADTVRRSTGRALARGGLRVLVWLGAIVGVVLVLVAAIALLAVQAAAPVVVANAPYPVYGEDAECSLDACGLPAEEAFHMGDGHRELRFLLEVTMESGGGVLRVTLTDPSGDTRLDRTYRATTEAQTLREHLTLPPTAGDWTIKYTHVAYRGELHADAWGIGVPVADFP